MASIASAAMIAQQVAGKAARDALYLSHFDVETLPVMMAGSAVVSLVAMVWLSKLMVRRSPARVVPAAFAFSGGAFLAEWALSFPAPGLAAIALYLHTALFGAVIVSAFWSLINETFVPHTGRNAVAWIAGGGTLGGVLGGFAAWRVAPLIAVTTMLPLLAAVNLVCVWSAYRIGGARAAGVPVPGEQAEAPAFAPLRTLRDAPYLRSLALVVALGAIISGLLDYVFSAEAAAAYHRGPQLLAFFATFWLVTGIVSFGVQMLLGRLVLEKLGLAVTVALLPAAVVIGGVLGMAAPGLMSMAVLRGAEATQRNSLFRSAYELLYTPIEEAKKRATKMLIDVGFDRLGTVAASGIAMATLAVAPARWTEIVLLAVMTGCALVLLVRTGRLHRGYVALLEENLRKAAPQLEPVPVAPIARAQEKVAVRDKIVEHLDGLRSEDPEAYKIATGGEDEAPTPEGSLEQPVLELTSGDPVRVRKVLAAEQPLPAPLVGFVILLLADKELHLDAIRALRRAAPRTTGQLTDALCDPSAAFDVRRRIPRVLADCHTQLAADGLYRGLDDERFEVRYACGRALLKVTSNPDVSIDLGRVISAVETEVARTRSVWQSALGDDEEDAETGLLDRLLLDRVDRSLEHVFNLLALHLDASALRTAFNALHTEDANLRGTALEYLDTVLPESVHVLVWPFLGEQRPMRQARPAQEILEDIARAGARPLQRT